MLFHEASISPSTIHDILLYSEVRPSRGSLPRTRHTPICRRQSNNKSDSPRFELHKMDHRLSADCSDASPSSVATILTSAASSCTDLWSVSGFVEEEDGRDDEHLHCESDEDEDEDMLVIPKIEPVEDDVNMADLIGLRSPSSGPPVKIKRPRGRPRKHPLPNADSLIKITKGRSKTGCITCRKRKKKCDEAKPRCEC